MATPRKLSSRNGISSMKSAELKNRQQGAWYQPSDGNKIPPTLRQGSVTTIRVACTECESPYFFF
ncbi:MAG: hypothetical protein KME59_10550 [Trichormus sp. ATA11-4-KO1]|nr:hypothetical protein [Trichormus sp. ATA11-4-KO1]